MLFAGQSQRFYTRQHGTEPMAFKVEVYEFPPAWMALEADSC